MIERLCAFDFDSTLIRTYEPDEGIRMWEDYYGVKYPHKGNGWWSKPESLDTKVFDISPNESVLNQLNFELSQPNTHVILLTSRIFKLRPEVEKILELNNIYVDEIDMKKSEEDKGVRILKYLDKYPNIHTINVYDDRDVEIDVFKKLKRKIPVDISFNIYKVTDGKISLTESIVDIVLDEIKKISIYL